MRKTAPNTFQITSTGLHSAVPIALKNSSTPGSKTIPSSRKSIAFAAQKDVLEFTDNALSRKKKSKGTRIGAGDKITQAVEGLTRAKKYLERERNLLSSKAFVPTDMLIPEGFPSSSDESDEIRADYEPGPQATIRKDHGFIRKEAISRFNPSMGHFAHFGLNEGISELQRTLEDAQERWDSRFLALEGSIVRLQDHILMSDEQSRRREQARLTKRTTRPCV
jgi:hypothetical protein